MEAVKKELLNLGRDYVVAVSTAAAVILTLFLLLQRKGKDVTGNWLPTKDNLAKRKFEAYALHYTVIWIGIFMVVLVLQSYETFTENGYMILCVSLSLPFLLQPFIWPFEGERNLPIYMRYSFKANVWIAIFSFVGNYWYTHYFYSVLKASYTFPAHRLNDVPIALYFATHFYFVTYHTFSNVMLRKIVTTYKAGWVRTFFFWFIVLAFSYFTAFMETLTISSFPYYCFGDRAMVYRIGSAFYGIYFIVSFPTFYRLDEKVNNSKNIAENIPPHTLYQTVYEAMGASMMVLLMLDFSRLALNIPLHIGGIGYYIYKEKIQCTATGALPTIEMKTNLLKKIFKF